MALLSRRRDRQAAMIAKAVEAGIEKATSRTVDRATNGAVGKHTIDLLPTNEDGSPRTAQDVQVLQDRLGSNGMRAAAMPRPASEFGAQLGPASPYIPSPLDPVDPVTGRAMPRRYEYQVAINLDLTRRRRVPWTVLRSLMDDCDLIHRCGEIRVSEIVGLEWDFAVSDHAVTRIMADNKISISEAQKIARAQFASDIDRMKAFWENPDQNADVGFSEWLTEALDQHFTYDAIAVYPRFTLAGMLIGLEVIDAPTIKVLRDNRGGLPMPPYPAYQQVLWGFPRGEFHASSGVPEQNQFRADQLSYFVRNRKTPTPYGYSTVEESMAASIIYMERQAWMRGEYTQATTPPTFIETDVRPDSMTPQQMAQWEGYVNDKLAGQTSERLRHKVLPGGFHPVQMQMVNERYTADYDEYLIKQVGSKWGIAPTQLGVIPRTGLSGRGQQEGEQDQADTLSKRPTEYWLADVINSLSRRYLGTSRDTTVTFSDPQTSDNDLAVAQAQAARLGCGARTINAIAIENGDPTYDMPEADEPFVLTSTGPVFLRGLLERQQQEPATPVIPPTGSAPAPDALPSATDVDAEVDKFVRFATRRRTDGVAWRDFAFEKVDGTRAGLLNKIGQWAPLELLDVQVAAIVKAGGADPKALGDSRPGQGGHREEPLTAHYAKAFADVMGLGLDARDIAEQWLALGVSTPQYEAASAFVMSLNAGDSGITSVASRLYPDAYAAGAKAGLDKLATVDIDAPGTELARVVQGIDWDTWTPGDPERAAQFADEGLEQILDRAGIEMKRVNGTTLGDLSQALANGILRGDSIDTMTKAIDAVLHDPVRAEMVARTEVNRAMTLGDLATYRQAGLSQFDWLDSPAACPACQAEVDDNPHELGDTTPPKHPNCRCATLPVLNTN